MEQLSTTCKTSKNSGGNNTINVLLSGIITPLGHNIANLEFKLVCPNGTEYVFSANSDWKSILTFYSWEDVKVKAVLNTLNMVLSPQKVFPKGIRGEIENVIELKDYSKGLWE